MHYLVRLFLWSLWFTFILPLFVTSLPYWGSGWRWGGWWGSCWGWWAHWRSWSGGKPSKRSRPRCFQPRSCRHLVETKTLQTEMQNSFNRQKPEKLENILPLSSSLTLTKTKTITNDKYDDNDKSKNIKRIFHRCPQDELEWQRMCKGCLHSEHDQL